MGNQTIKAKDAKPLCWYGYDDIILLCVCEGCGGRAMPMFAYRDDRKELIQTRFVQNEAAITPLPDCDSWDWEPMPEPEIDPGQGWRLLEHEEPVIYGDECKFPNEIDSEWRKSENYIHADGQQSRGMQYRRRISQPNIEPNIDPGYGWRLLGKNESTKPGDQYLLRGDWYEIKQSNESIRWNTYRRRIEPGEGWRFIDCLKEKPESRDEILLPSGEWTTRYFPEVDFDDTSIYRRKLQPPKQYRAFANAAEYALHANRWFLLPDSEHARSVNFTDDEIISLDCDGNILITPYAIAYRKWTFDDGTPFGIEVTS